MLQLAGNARLKSGLAARIRTAQLACAAANWSKLAFLACLLLVAPAAYAADITLSDTCSLANAIRSANGDDQVAPANECAAGDAEETDVITFVADVEITAALPAIVSDIRIDGANKRLAAPTASDANNNFSLLTMNSGDIRIENLSLGGVDDSALLIRKTTENDLNVLFNLGSISGNNAARHGGAVYVTGGADVTIHTSKISSNSAANGHGGAIYVYNSSLTIKWSNIHDNSASINGGAIFFSNESATEHKLTLDGNNFRRNTVTDDDDSTATDERGGAVYIDNAVHSDEATSTIENGNFTSHLASYGGAIYLAAGKLQVDNTTIDENTASGQGGGIYVAGGSLTIRHATITANQAANGGGLAIFSDDDEETSDPEVSVYNSIISGNTDTDEENSLCLTDLLAGNEGNIIEGVNCVEAQSAGVPLQIELVASPGGSLPRSVSTRFYRLLEGSPAIDHGVDTPGLSLNSDQTGHLRPQVEGYDSGAFEFDFAELWTVADSVPGSNVSLGVTTVLDADGIEVSVHTCLAVNEADNGITVAATLGLKSGTMPGYRRRRHRHPVGY